MTFVAYMFWFICNTGRRRQVHHHLPQNKYSLSIVIARPVQTEHIFEQTGDKTCKKTSVSSKDADQPVHLPNTTSVLVYSSLDSMEAVKTHAISEDSDQTAR